MLCLPKRVRQRLTYDSERTKKEASSYLSYCIGQFCKHFLSTFSGVCLYQVLELERLKL